MSKPKHSALLSVLPICLVLLSVLLQHIAGPYYLANNLDPDYAYLLNSLNILTFHTPGHTDHPGTTAQIFGAFVLLLTWIVHSFSGPLTPLQVSVLANPESYLHAIGVAMTISIAVLMYFAGRRALQLTHSWPTAIVLQLTPFLSFDVLTTMFHVKPEPLLTAAGLALAIPLLPLVLHDGASCDGNQLRRAGIAGAIFAFGVISKITFLPVGLFVFLFPGRRARAAFAGAAFIASLVFLVPVLTEAPRMFRWFVSLAFYSERYGQGKLGLPSLAVLAKNVSNLYYFEAGMFWFLCYYAGVLLVVWGLTRLAMRPGESRLAALLAVGVACIGIQLALTIKHCASHYLVAGFAIMPLLNAALAWRIPKGSLPRAPKLALLAVGLLLGVGAAAHSWNVTRNWSTSTGSYLAEVKRLDEVVAKMPECVKIGYYRSSFSRYALLFGNDFAGGVHHRILARLYPEVVSFNIWNGRFVTFSADVPIEKVEEWVARGRCVVVTGTPPASELRARLSGIAVDPVIAGDTEGVYRLRLRAAAPAIEALVR